MKSHFAKLFVALLCTAAAGAALTCISMGIHRAMMESQQPPIPADPVEAANQANVVLKY